MKVIAAAIILTLLPVLGFTSDSSSQVRDRYGNLVETKDRHGDETSVRDYYGNITRNNSRKSHAIVILKNRLKRAVNG
ncbi:MAG: hypothetical protein ACYDHG_15595 [Desulfomonilaceae bacterium]